MPLLGPDHGSGPLPHQRTLPPTSARGLACAA